MVYGAQRNGVMAGAIATGERGLRSKVQILINQQIISLHNAYFLFILNDHSPHIVRLLVAKNNKQKNKFKKLNVMKKLLVLSALVLGLVSCSKDELPTSDCGCKEIVNVVWEEKAYYPNYGYYDQGYYDVETCEGNEKIYWEQLPNKTIVVQKIGECYKVN